MIHPTAEVDPRAIVDESAFVWHLAQIREFAVVGPETSIGRGAYVGPGVHLGSMCKIQNGAMIYEPAMIEDGVFIGPGVILTNDRHPRAMTTEGRRKTGNDWEPVGVQVLEGASIGAGAVCVAPLTVGRWALVAAGAVVTKDVRDYSLVSGAPARHIGWIGRAGRTLKESPNEPGVLLCPVSGKRYVLRNGDLFEDQS